MAPVGLRMIIALTVGGYFAAAALSAYLLGRTGNESASLLAWFWPGLLFACMAFGLFEQLAQLGARHREDR